jgi:hypothetical protein
MLQLIACIVSATGMLALAPRDQIGVSVAPGMTVLTLMPLGASYEAKTLAIAVMPPFVAA